jgi:predicted PurR-regulated permease PerM
MTEPYKTSRLLTLVTVVLVVAVLYLARDVLIPFALAALISFLLAPLVVRLERFFGRVASVVVVVLLTCGVLGGIGYLVAGQLTQLAGMLPEYRANIAAKLGVLRGGAIEKAQEAVKQIEADLQAQQAAEDEAKREREQQAGAETGPPLAGGTDDVKPVPVEVLEPEPSPLDMLAAALGPLLGPLGTGGMVIVLILFMLLARADLRDRVVRLMGLGRITLTTQALDEVGERVSRYLLMQTLINCIHGVAVAVGMFFLDVPNFLLWGLLSAVLRFIPYVGPWIAAAMPVLVSLAVFDNWTQPLLVVGYFVVLELLSNNALEPWLYGSSAGVSPFAVIVTAIFWTWLWGPIGLLLATPLTVCMVVVAKHAAQLRFISILLGEESVLEPHTRFYQRLVAMDHEAAAEVCEKQLQQRTPLIDVYDQVLIPALGLAEMDRHRDELDERRAQFLHSSLRDMIEELADTAARRPAAAGSGSPPPEPGQPATRFAGGNGRQDVAAPPPPAPVLAADFNVLVVPARDEADELVGAMLAQLVRASGGKCEAVSMLARASGMIDLVQQSAPDLVCISAMPPSALSQARHVYKRLVTRFPDLPILIGLWNGAQPVAQVQERIGSTGDTPVVTTLRGCLEELDRMARLRPDRARHRPEAGAAKGA